MSNAPKLQGQIPVLAGWVNLNEAGDMIGVTRQHAYRMAKDGKWKSLHQVGTRPTYVVSIEEVEAKRAERKPAKESEPEVADAM